MDLGIGLAGHAPWRDGRAFVETARRAEARGFDSVTVGDRLLWSTPEPLTLLAAVASATERVRLQTSVLLAPLHANHVLFAKSVLTLDHLAGPHRLHLGLASGFREDDFTASAVPYTSRGARFDALLSRLEEAYHDRAGLGLSPATPGGPPLLFGGTSAATLRRTATRGVGWLAGTAEVHDLDAFVPRLRRAWSEQDRAGAPRVVASTMFALGPDARAAIKQAIGRYYAFAGDAWAEQGIATALTTPEQVAAAVSAFDQHGCDELVLTCNDPDPRQVDLLADALGR